MRRSAAPKRHGSPLSTSGPLEAAGRSVGRPRDLEVTARIRRVARAAFAQRGFAAVSMSEIAAGAEVGLDSIYRRWPSKPALLVDVVTHVVASEVVVPDCGSLRRDLELMIAGLADSMDGDLGILLSAAIAEAAIDPRLADQIVAAYARRRDATLPVIERAVDRGELSRGTDASLLLDLLAGYVWQHCLVTRRGARPIDAGRAVVAVLDGIEERSPS